MHSAESLQAYPIKLNFNQIQELIPHRPPFIFVTNAEIISVDKINGWCRWDKGNPILEGHFPEFPIVPGVLLVEAAAQLVAAIISYSAQTYPDRFRRTDMPTDPIGVLTIIKRVMFHKPVFPDEIIFYRVVLNPPVGFMFIAQCEAIGSDEKKICTCEIGVAIADRSNLSTKLSSV